METFTRKCDDLTSFEDYLICYKKIRDADCISKCNSLRRRHVGMQGCIVKHTSVTTIAMCVSVVHSNSILTLMKVQRIFIDLLVHCTLGYDIPIIHRCTCNDL